MTEYVAAWRAKDTALLAQVLNDDITYKTSPFAEPLVGLDAVKKFWLEATAEGEEFTITHALVAIEGDIAVLRVDVHYTAPIERTWKDLWIVQIGDDGLCFTFEEWPIEQPKD